jgi:hypothetical protein
VKVKTGNTAGVGRINEKVHIIASQKHDLQYLQQASDVEQSSSEESDEEYIEVKSSTLVNTNKVQSINL